MSLRDDIVEATDDASRPVERAARRWFGEVIREVVANVQEAERSHVLGYTRQLRQEQVFDERKWSQRLQRLLAPGILKAAEDGHDFWQGRITFSGDFASGSNQVRETTQEILGRMQWTARTLRDDVAGILQQGLQEELSDADIIRRLRRKLRDRSRSEVQRITRTAGGGGFQVGQMQAFDKAGIEEHIWRSVRTGQHRRQNHLNMDGETVKLNERFSNGLRWPRDPQGPPGEIYNCQCYTQPVPPDAS